MSVVTAIVGRRGDRGDGWMGKGREGESRRVGWKNLLRSLFFSGAFHGDHTAYEITERRVVVFNEPVVSGCESFHHCR